MYQDLPYYIFKRFFPTYIDQGKVDGEEDDDPHGVEIGQSEGGIKTRLVRVLSQLGEGHPRDRD